MIDNELDEIQMVTFIEHGQVQFGYDINKKQFWKLRYSRAVLGSFEVLFDKRCYFNVRAVRESTGYFIRKHAFKQLDHIFKDGFREIRQQQFDYYINLIRKPMQQLKNQDLAKFSDR